MTLYELLDTGVGLWFILIILELFSEVLITIFCKEVNRDTLVMVIPLLVLHMQEFVSWL